MCYVHGTALEAFRMGSEKKKKKTLSLLKKELTIQSEKIMLTHIKTRDQYHI